MAVQGKRECVQRPSDEHFILCHLCVLGVMESAQERDSGSCRTCGRMLACSKHPANVNVSFSDAFKADVHDTSKHSPQQPTFRLIK